MYLAPGLPPQHPSQPALCASTSTHASTVRAHYHHRPGLWTHKGILKGTYLLAILPLVGLVRTSIRCWWLLTMLVCLGLFLHRSRPNVGCIIYEGCDCNSWKDRVVYSSSPSVPSSTTDSTFWCPRGPTVYELLWFPSPLPFFLASLSVVSVSGYILTFHSFFWPAPNWPCI